MQEYATQVITNFASGKDWKAAFTEVDGGAILESAIIDGVTMGIGSLVTKTKTVVKLVKAADKAVDTEKAIIKTNKVKNATETIAKQEKNLVKATKKVDISNATKKADEGIIYKRTNPKTGKEYIGQAKNEENYLKRQKSHDTKLDTKHKYEKIDTGKPGKDLNVKEETHIRKNGGPENKGGKLENKRYQMNDKNFKAAGGKETKPTGGNNDKMTKVMAKF